MTFDGPPPQVFDIDFFQSNPRPFYRLCREMWPGQYTPTCAHRSLRELHAECADCEMWPGQYTPTCAHRFLRELHAECADCV